MRVIPVNTVNNLSVQIRSFLSNYHIPQVAFLVSYLRKMANVLNPSGQKCLNLKINNNNK